MVRWTPSELERLSPVLDRLVEELGPLEGGRVLVLCSASGEVAFYLAGHFEGLRVTGLEMDEGLLEKAKRSSRELGLDDRIEFLPPEVDRIPLPSDAFDALVSEFVLYPTPLPTEIGQPEMARVVRSGGRVVLTDVVVTRDLTVEEGDALEAIGLDYLCEATPADFRRWMGAAGLQGVGVVDLTPLVRGVWERRRHRARSQKENRGFELLLDEPEHGLGGAILYLLARGTKV